MDSSCSMEAVRLQQRLSLEAAPLPFVISTGGIMGLGAHPRR